MADTNPFAQEEKASPKIALDLCCGKGGGTQAFRGQPSWHVVGVDNEKKFAQYWVGENVHFVLADVTAIDWESFMEDIGIPRVDFLWASPPCERFSIACPEFPRKGIRRALETVGSCLEAVTILKPQKWLLENPRGRLRWFLGTPKQTIRYSDYDMNYKINKFTDLWGNTPLGMVRGERHIHTGSVRNCRDKKGRLHSLMGSDPSVLAFVPYGVSDAVFQAVQTRINGES